MYELFKMYLSLFYFLGKKDEGNYDRDEGGSLEIENENK